MLPYAIIRVSHSVYLPGDSPPPTWYSPRHLFEGLLSHSVYMWVQVCGVLPVISLYDFIAIYGQVIVRIYCHQHNPYRQQITHCNMCKQALVTHRSKCRLALVTYRSKCRLALVTHCNKCRLALVTHRRKCRLALVTHRSKCRLALVTHRSKCRLPLVTHRRKCRLALVTHRSKCRLA